MSRRPKSRPARDAIPAFATALVFAILAPMPTLEINETKLGVIPQPGNGMEITRRVELVLANGSVRITA